MTPERRVAETAEALEAAREFIERFSDVIDGQDGPEPNQAMQIVAMIDEVLR